MTFEELNEIFQKEFGATKLSDIAQEFNVTPQVVSNWKTRNQVPYKYIVSLRTKIQKQKELNVNSKTYLLDRKMQRSSDESEDDNIYETLVKIYSSVKNNLKTLALLIFFSTSLTFFHVTYIAKPVYESVSKIMAKIVTLIKNKWYSRTIWCKTAYIWWG